MTTTDIPRGDEPDELMEKEQEALASAFRRGREYERKTLVEMVKGLQVEQPNRECEEMMFSIKNGWIFEMRNALLSAFEANEIK